MSDLISRQATIEALMTDASYQMVDDWGNLTQDGEVILRVINELPSAEPGKGKYHYFRNRWIPVTERLPKKHGETYIVTISDGAVYSTALQWDANRKRWYLSFLNDGNILVDFIDDVTAWMPLPEPWKG